MGSVQKTQTTSPQGAGGAIEYKIHNTAKRIDLLLSGHNTSGAPSAVIVELTQWETVESTELDGVARSTECNRRA